MQHNYLVCLLTVVVKVSLFAMLVSGLKICCVNRKSTKELVYYLGI